MYYPYTRTLNRYLNPHNINSTVINCIKATMIVNPSIIILSGSLISHSRCTPSARYTTSTLLTILQNTVEQRDYIGKNAWRTSVGSWIEYRMGGIRFMFMCRSGLKSKRQRNLLLILEPANSKMFP